MAYVLAAMVACLVMALVVYLLPARRKPFYLKNVRPLDGLLRDHPLPGSSEITEGFNQLCEDGEADKVRKHFGIVGGVTPRPRHTKAGKLHLTEWRE